jgi:hypothetical protein
LCHNYFSHENSPIRRVTIFARNALPIDEQDRPFGPAGTAAAIAAARAGADVLLVERYNQDFRPAVLSSGSTA